MLELTSSICSDIKYYEEKDAITDPIQLNIKETLEAFQRVQLEPKHVSLVNFTVFKFDDCIYQGSLSNNLPHGKGIEICSDKRRYAGEFENGKRCGNGLILENSSEITYINQTSTPGNSFWIGQFTNNKLYYGIQKDLNGSVFVGEFDGFKPNGKNSQISTAVDVYAGKYSDGVFANGTYIKQTSDNILVYRGTWNGTWFNNGFIGIKQNYDIFIGNLRASSVYRSFYYVYNSKDLITRAYKYDWYIETNDFVEIDSVRATWD
jgi:hypothetical protein